MRNNISGERPDKRLRSRCDSMHRLFTRIVSIQHWTEFMLAMYPGIVPDRCGTKPVHFVWCRLLPDRNRSNHWQLLTMRRWLVPEGDGPESVQHVWARRLSVRNRGDDVHILPGGQVQRRRADDGRVRVPRVYARGDLRAGGAGPRGGLPHGRAGKGHHGGVRHVVVPCAKVCASWGPGVLQVSLRQGRLLLLGPQLRPASCLGCSHQACLH